MIALRIHVSPPAIFEEGNETKLCMGLEADVDIATDDLLKAGGTDVVAEQVIDAIKDRLEVLLYEEIRRNLKQHMLKR